MMRSLQIMFNKTLGCRNSGYWWVRMTIILWLYDSVFPASARRGQSTLNLSPLSLTTDLSLQWSYQMTIFSKSAFLTLQLCSIFLIHNYIWTLSYVLKAKAAWQRWPLKAKVHFDKTPNRRAFSSLSHKFRSRAVKCSHKCCSYLLKEITVIHPLISQSSEASSGGSLLQWLLALGGITRASSII